MLCSTLKDWNTVIAITSLNILSFKYIIYDIFFIFVGDPRVNQHWGITVYHTIFVRFHNFVADMFQVLYPGWIDELLYQEVRQFVGAINQIIFYRDFLPILLGI